MELANRRWSEMVGDYRDDITATVVCLPFLPPPASDVSSLTEGAEVEGVTRSAVSTAVAGCSGVAAPLHSGDLVEKPGEKVMVDEPGVAVKGVECGTMISLGGSNLSSGAGRAVKSDLACCSPGSEEGKNRSLRESGGVVADGVGQGSLGSIVAEEALLGQGGGVVGVGSNGVRGAEESALRMEEMNSEQTATPSVTSECPSEDEGLDQDEMGRGEVGLGVSGSRGGVGRAEGTKSLLVVVSEAVSCVAGRGVAVAAEVEGIEGMEGVVVSPIHAGAVGEMDGGRGGDCGEEKRERAEGEEQEGGRVIRERELSEARVEDLDWEHPPREHRETSREKNEASQEFPLSEASSLEALVTGIVPRVHHAEGGGLASF
ncbi:unnamed protein product [Choristocarpus tenellus]